MVMVYQCDTFCDLCMDWIGGEGTQHGTPNGLATSAKQIAKDNGWIRRRGGDGCMQDICPACQAKDKAAAQA